MPTTCRTYVCRIQNHSQVVDALDRHGWSASKLWNVALYHARNQWDETGEIPGEDELKDELKTHSKYNGLPVLLRFNHQSVNPFTIASPTSCAFSRSSPSDSAICVAIS
jgi:hypothetical protein